MFVGCSDRSSSPLPGDTASRPSPRGLDAPENWGNGSGARFPTWRAESKRRPMSQGATKMPGSSGKSELVGVCREKSLNSQLSQRWSRPPKKRRSPALPLLNQHPSPMQKGWQPTQSTTCSRAVGEDGDAGARGSQAARFIWRSRR